MVVSANETDSTEEVRFQVHRHKMTCCDLPVCLQPRFRWLQMQTSITLRLQLASPSRSCWSSRSIDTAAGQLQRSCVLSQTVVVHGECNASVDWLVHQVCWLRRQCTLDMLFRRYIDCLCVSLLLPVWTEVQPMPEPLAGSCFRLVLLFWYQLTLLVPDKRSLNGCCVS